MKTPDYTPCNFSALTTHGPFYVEGNFLTNEGLCVVIHPPYGANKEKPGLCVSDYQSGMLLSGPTVKRSELLAKVSEYIKECGDVATAKWMLRHIAKVHMPSQATEEYPNKALLPEGY